MKYRFKGLEKYISQLENLTNPVAVEALMKEAVYKGAEVVANETRRELEKLPTDDSKYVKGGTRKSIRSVQKSDLIKSFGISRFQDNRGFLNVKTGVDRSYNRLDRSNLSVARQLESGTSYMPKNPVFSRASRKAREGCLEAMQESFNKSIERLMK